MNITAIKQQNDIGTVLSRYLSITQKGRKGIALCPFHDDHHPSLTVDYHRQTFVCFACGAKGDVITFIQLIEKCDFPAALTKLQPFPVEAKPPQKKQPAEKMQTTLPLRPIEGLMPYAAGEARLSAVWLDFEVGQSPHLVHPEHYGQGGKLIFPVRDENGMLRGYSARRLTAGGNEAKYIHTPSKYGFKSSHHLYGLYRAKESIRQTNTLILTEGFKDTLALHAAGYTQTVALMGTNLSGTQLTLIQKSEATRILVLLDGDTAGRRAAQQIKTQLQQTGARILIAGTPGNEDPDSLYRKWDYPDFSKWISEQLYPPTHEENLLIGVCLQYPDVTVPYEGKEYPFAIIVDSFIQNESLPMAREEHQSILTDLAYNECTRQEKMEETRTQYQHKYASELPDKADPAILYQYLYNYIEARTIEEIQTITHQLKTETTPEKRQTALTQLKKRKTQLSEIARIQNQSPAIKKG